MEYSIVLSDQAFKIIDGIYIAGIMSKFDDKDLYVLK